MLPLDKPCKDVISVLLREGVTENDIEIAFRMDLDMNGDFGDVWLLLNIAHTVVYRADARADSLEKFELSSLSGIYVDSFTTSNRLLAHRNGINGEDITIVLGNCTNACKRKLFAFVNVLEKIQGGGTVSEDDSVFEQFNAKCPKCGTVYADQQRRICEHCANRSGTFVRLLSYFKDFKLQLVCVLICMLISSFISLATPIISGQVLYDQVISAPTFAEDGTQLTGKLHEEKYVYITVLVIVGLALLALLVSIVQNRANAYMSTHVTRNMKNTLFASMQRLSLSFFNKNATGRLINRINSDVAQIRSFYIDGLPYLIVNLLNFIGLTFFLFSINWKLTLIVFFPVPFIVLIFKYRMPVYWRAHSSSWRRKSSMNAMLGDSLNGIRVVKAFSKEAEESFRFYNYCTRLYKSATRVNLVYITIFPIVGLLIGMSSTAIWGFGGINVMNKTMTYGELTTYLGYVGMIFGPLNYFTNFANILTDTMNIASRQFEIIDTVPEIIESRNAREIKEIKGDIVFDEVSFHYNPNRPILRNISFKINPGQHIGMVGHTGSGKSTLANLLTRMYDTVSGSIKIDGIDIKNIKLETLRKNIAIVSQEVYLFRGTIADNIKYARQDATKEEIINAAKLANAHDFIMRLPEGYETTVGIGSRTLSGGERQRISIARALLLNPSLLILDEATAAMDTQTEKLISQAIDSLAKNRTTITIAHRLSTLKNCDYIIAVEDGEIAEMGTPAELLAKRGVYYKLYTLQNEQMNKVMKGE